MVTDRLPGAIDDDGDDYGGGAQQQSRPPMTAVEQAFYSPSPADENPVRDLFTKKNLKMKSEIPPNLIIPLARGYVVAEATHSQLLQKFLDTILELQVSKERRGRIEYMESIVAGRRREEEEY